MRRSIGFACLLVAAADCADIAPMTRDVCGNGIVEPANAEECDTYPSGTCGEPTMLGACRYRCVFGSNEVTCPDGFGCGADGICRRGSTSYEPGSNVTHAAVERLARGDFDGDSRGDLVTVGDEGTVAHLFESAGEPRAVRVTQRSDEVQAMNLELVSGQRRDDLVIVDTRFPDSYGIMIYDASDERVFNPKFASLTTIPAAPLLTTE